MAHFIDLAWSQLDVDILSLTLFPNKIRVYLVDRELTMQFFQVYVHLKPPKKQK